MKKKIGIIKKYISILLIFLLSINSFAAIVSDNDGSAFITKAEFDALKSSFQSQIDSYNQSIDSKIDGAIASYLEGIKLTTVLTLRLDPNSKYAFPIQMDHGQNFWQNYTAPHYDVSTPFVNYRSYTFWHDANQEGDAVIAVQPTQTDKDNGYMTIEPYTAGGAPRTGFQESLEIDDGLFGQRTIVEKMNSRTKLINGVTYPVYKRLETGQGKNMCYYTPSASMAKYQSSKATFGPNASLYT